MSSYFEVDRLDRKTAKGVIPKLKKHMARFGIPEKVVSDNGQPFACKEFRDFEKAYQFKHVTSSPLYPQSNGKVENAVKTAKRLMKKASHAGKDAHLAILDFRNTPAEGVGLSPAQVMFGRRTRTLLPVSRKLLKQDGSIQEKYRDKLSNKRTKQAEYYNRGAKDLKTLKPGESVRIKPFGHDKTWKKGVVEQEEGIRSYRVKTEGVSYRRNRKHLRATNEVFYDNAEVLDRSSENVPISRSSENYSVPINKSSQNVEISGKCVNQSEIEASDGLREYVASHGNNNIITEPPSTQPSDSGYTTTRRGRSVKKPEYLKDYVT